MAVTTSEPLVNYFNYASDDGSAYNLRANQAWGQAAASGGTAANSPRAYGRSSRRRSTRKAIFRDPLSFRTFTGVVVHGGGVQRAGHWHDYGVAFLEGGEHGCHLYVHQKGPRENPDHGRWASGFARYACCLMYVDPSLALIVVAIINAVANAMTSALHAWAAAKVMARGEGSSTAPLQPS